MATAAAPDDHFPFEQLPPVWDLIAKEVITPGCALSSSLSLPLSRCCALSPTVSFSLSLSLACGDRPTARCREITALAEREAAAAAPPPQTPQQPSAVPPPPALGLTEAGLEIAGARSGGAAGIDVHGWLGATAAAPAAAAGRVYAQLTPSGTPAAELSALWLRQLSDEVPGPAFKHMQQQLGELNGLYAAALNQAAELMEARDAGVLPDAVLVALHGLEATGVLETVAAMDHLNGLEPVAAAVAQDQDAETQPCGPYPSTAGVWQTTPEHCIDF